MPEYEKDLFRDTWLRYLGYANEVGESFRALVPVKVVHASYGVAFAYVLADTGHKSWNMIRNDGRAKKVAIEAGDVLVWQTLASVIIPGFTINRICTYSRRYLHRTMPKIAPTPLNIITVAIGLVSIPIIIHPIDGAVTVLMNHTYRKWFKS